MAETRSVILCLSGGLDSVTMLYWLHNEGVKVHALLFDYGQRHVQELIFAKGHCGRLGVMFSTMDIPALKGSCLTNGGNSVVVPNRNAVFLSLAVNKAIELKSPSVLFAANKDDAEFFPDCRPAFVAAFNKTLTAAELPVTVEAPFIRRSKAWVAALSRDVGVPSGEYWTCYQGGIKPCGKCLACQKLKEAFA